MPKAELLYDELLDQLVVNPDCTPDEAARAAVDWVYRDVPEEARQPLIAKLSEPSVTWSIQNLKYLLGQE